MVRRQTVRSEKIAKLVSGRGPDELLTSHGERRSPTIACHSRHHDPQDADVKGDRQHNVAIELRWKIMRMLAHRPYAPRRDTGGGT